MALVLRDRVQETGSANTTVSFTLTGAVSGFQDFTVIGNGNTTYYSATDASGNWEVGIGTYSTTGPTLDRTTILSSSNSNNAVTFSGTVNVFVTYPSSKSVNLDGTNNVSSLGTVSSGTWQGSTIGVAYGGTGVTTSSGANSVVLRDTNQNIQANNFSQNLSITTSSAGTTVLSVSSAHYQVLVGTSTHTFQLPDATTLLVGTSFIFDNDSTQNLTITDGATGAIDTIPPGGYATVFLEDNSTIAGTWNRYGMLPAEVNWGTNSLNLGGSTVVTGGTWQGSTIGVAYGGTGVTTVPTNGELLIGNGTGYSVANLSAGTGISVTNGSGSITITNTAPSLGGDVVGPASSTDNAVARFDGTTGKLIQNSAVTIADDGTTVISVNSSTDALRITQTGAGNAILVEDSANPDATPFVVQNDGRTVIGNTTSLNVGGNAGFEGLQVVGASSLADVAMAKYIASSVGTNLTFAKSRGASLGTNTIVQDSDFIGLLRFNGADGTSFVEAARIASQVDGSPATGSMPGRLVFSTTASGSSTPTERMRIDSAGKVGIGSSSLTGQNLRIGTNITGATSSNGIWVSGQIQSDVTSTANYVNATVTQAAATTTTNVRLFNAEQSTVSGTITNQFGFNVSSNLTGATNNFGFYSNIASGTGRWNFYANGTAANYFAGNVGIGTTNPTFNLDINIASATFRIRDSSAGNDFVFKTIAGPVTLAGSTANTAISFITNDTERIRVTNTGLVGVGTNTPDKQFEVEGTDASTTTVGVGLLVTNASSTTDTRAGIVFRNFDNYGASIWSRRTGSTAGNLCFGTNNAAGVAETNIVERMRIDNAGRVGFNTTDLAAVNYRFAGNVSGATSSYFHYSEPVVQSSVTNLAATYLSLPSTQAASFTISNLQHFNATQGTIGAGSTVTSQIGFVSASNLIGGVNNFGFLSNIAAGAGRWNFYAGGTAQNYFAGTTLVGTLTNTNSSTLVSGGTISETVSSVQYLVASQYDVGNAPNQIPLNQYLGTMAYQDANSVIVTSLTASGSIKETRAVIAASNIDLNLGNYFTRTISGTTTFTVSNIPASGTAVSFILDLTNGGSATVNWFANVRWAGGVAPTLTAAGRDSLGFYTYDGGANWTGLLLGKDIK